MMLIEMLLANGDIYGDENSVAGDEVSGCRHADGRGRQQDRCGGSTRA